MPWWSGVLLRLCAFVSDEDTKVWVSMPWWSGVLLRRVLPPGVRALLKERFHALVVGRSAATSMNELERQVKTCFHALVVGRSAATWPSVRHGGRLPCFHALVVGRSAATIFREVFPQGREECFHALVVGRSAATDLGPTLDSA